MKNLFTSVLCLISISIFGQNQKQIALLEIKPKIVKIVSDKNYIGKYDEKKCPCEKSLAKFRDRSDQSWPVLLNRKTEIIFYVKNGEMFKIEY